MRRFLDSPYFYFGLAGLLLVVAIASQFRYGTPPKPVGGVDEILALREQEDWNLVFFLIDTLRADRLSAYGYERPTSPHIDELARGGIRFANVEAQSSWTKTSMASMWTARFPQATGILRFNHGLPEEVLMPAEILQDAGLYTAGIYRNGWVAANFGFGQGFDLYIKPKANYNVERFKKRSPATPNPLQGTDLDLTESAVEFLQAHATDRFFLYIHYMDVHQYAYDADSNLFGSSFSDIYDNGIHWTDSNLGQVMRALELLDLRNNTIVVVASDHGEAFFEHGVEGHAKELYREVQQTPWIVSLPFDLEPGVVVDTQVANVDIWPTLFDLLGIDEFSEADGISTLPLILAAARGEDESKVPEFEGRTVFSQLDRSWGKPQLPSNPFVALVKTPYRLHVKTKKNLVRLYDHSNDPLEAKNIAQNESELVAELRDEVRAYMEDSKPYWEATEVELDEMRLNQLRALGYAVPSN